jgi:hypothetical protein
MPPSIHLMLRLMYVEKVDLSDITAADLQVGKLLKKEQPDIYKELKKHLKKGHHQ